MGKFLCSHYLVTTIKKILPRITMSRGEIVYIYFFVKQEIASCRLRVQMECMEMFFSLAHSLWPNF